MPWDNVACCATCWNERNPDRPCPPDGRSRTHPSYEGEAVSAACFYCTGPIYGGVIYVREQVLFKEPD